MVLYRSLLREADALPYLALTILIVISGEAAAAAKRGRFRFSPAKIVLTYPRIIPYRPTADRSAPDAPIGRPNQDNDPSRQRRL